MPTTFASCVRGSNRSRSRKRPSQPESGEGRFACARAVTGPRPACRSTLKRSRARTAKAPRLVEPRKPARRIRHCRDVADRVVRSSALPVFIATVSLTTLDSGGKHSRFDARIAFALFLRQLLSPRILKVRASPLDRSTSAAAGTAARSSATRDRRLDARKNGLRRIRRYAAGRSGCSFGCRAGSRAFNSDSVQRCRCGFAVIARSPCASDCVPAVTRRYRT